MDLLDQFEKYLATGKLPEDWEAVTAETEKMQKTGKRSAAPISSIISVVFRMKLVSRTIPPTYGADTDSCIVLLCHKPIFMPDALITASPMVITPIPPICISVMITPCPKYDQYVAVSCTMRPVTQVADVAVNSASENGVIPCPFEDIGNISSRVPSIISAKKLKMIIWNDDIPLRFFRLNNRRIFVPLSF